MGEEDEAFLFVFLLGIELLVSLVVSPPSPENEMRLKILPSSLRIFVVELELLELDF